MRWIYISPHLDDAALSAGGWIREQVRAGADVEIWTLLAGFPSGEISPFAQMLHRQWGVSDSAELIRARRAEDARAASLLGAQTAHFDFLDCIYRRGKNGDWLYADVFVAPHEDENDLPAQMAEWMSARLKPDDQVVCQFGIGAHVDHILVRRAAELLARPLFYAADIPYLFNAPQELLPHTAGMKEHRYAISESALRAWQDAVGAYESQLSGLFENRADMRAKIEQYARENGGVRLWSPG